MKPYWVSWWEDEEFYPTFEYHGPWWISGQRDVQGGTVDYSMCAAVMAESEEDAKLKIEAAHDNPCELDWRFVEECEPGWEPFSSRFARRDWMKWPWPTEPPPAAAGVEPITQGIPYWESLGWERVSEWKWQRGRNAIQYNDGYKRPWLYEPYGADALQFATEEEALTVASYDLGLLHRESVALVETGTGKGGE